MKFQWFCWLLNARLLVQNKIPTVAKELEKRNTKPVFTHLKLPDPKKRLIVIIKPTKKSTFTEI
jgi:hypothetical protein